MINRDNDQKGITVSPISGLVTTEVGGTDRFTVVLDQPPTSFVELRVTSIDSTEWLATGTLRFEPDDWNIPQTVTITGKDDGIPDGDITDTIDFQVFLSDDLDYRYLDPADVSVTNIDT